MSARTITGLVRGNLQEATLSHQVLSFPSDIPLNRSNYIQRHINDKNNRLILLGALEHVFLPIQLGSSSSQLRGLPWLGSLIHWTAEDMTADLPDDWKALEWEWRRKPWTR